MRLILIILYSFTLLANTKASDIKFHNINSIYGTSIKETMSVCKDKSGFIWASSKYGIQRITDSDCRTYQLPFESVDLISIKMIYGDSQLYAFTNNSQIFKYDQLQDQFILFLNLRKHLKQPNLGLYDMQIGKDGAIWISLSEGLYKYTTQSGLEKKYPKTFFTIRIDTKDNLFFSTENDIGVFNTHTSNVQYFNKGTIEKEFNISTLYYDKETQRLWVGTVSSGLYYYDIRKKLFSKISISNLPKQPILAIDKISGSSLLIGIDGQGVWELSPDGNTVIRINKEDVDNPSSLQGDGVYDIFCDNNKRVWIATYTGGLSFYNLDSPLISTINHRINDKNSLSNNFVNKVIEDSKGNIWFATNNGISKWEVSVNQWKTYYQNNHKQAQVFLTLCEDKDGHIWTGTYSSGFYVLDSNTGQEIMHYSENPNFSSRFVFDIYKDSDDDIWIGGTRNNVICYLTKEKHFRVYSSQPVKAFTEISPGKILLSCTYGLILLDKKTGEEKLLIKEANIQDAIFRDNTIWLATSGRGLIKYDYLTAKINHFSTDSGLLSNHINSIMYADRYLWIGTENGLCRLDPTNNHISSYPSSLFSLFNFSFSPNASSQLANGKLIWGTNKGAIVFDPSILNEVQMQGRIFFQDINISGKSIRKEPKLMKGIPVNNQNNITLKYNQNTLSLELLPIGISTTDTKISWKMEGLDKDWNKPTKFQHITYANMPSGSFTLKIRMYDNALSHIIDERSLEIYIIPAFWQTWWFIILILLIITGVVFSFLKAYTNKLKQKHDKDKIRFFTNTAHDIRTSLTLINAPIEELNKETALSEKGKYYLSLATEQLSQLSSVTTQLLDFQKADIGKGQVFLIMADIVNLVNERKSRFDPLAQKKNIKLLFSSNNDHYKTAVDELKIGKVIDNLISNALKYSSENSNIEINLICDKKQWSLEVRDFGIGISENVKTKLFKEFHRGDNAINSKIVGSGIGLLLVKNFVTMHNGEVYLDSKENEGSSFKIVIPFLKITENSYSVTIPEITTNESHIGLSVHTDKTNNDETGVNKGYILIVEDNNDLQTFLRCSLQDQYNTKIAGDGTEAWKLIKEDAPDLVISDIMMPNMNGFDLCQTIKSTFETSHIPVILLTALSEKPQQIEGLGLGADDYITKPFDMQILLQRITTILFNRKIMRNKALKVITQPNPDEKLFANEHNDLFLKKAISVVNENISNSTFGKEEFASAMHVSSSLLYKKLKTLSDQSPTNFVKIIRLNHALELLQQQNYSITEISELCGFSSIEYFSTVFKKHFGKSPTELIIK